jgi:hypothetical protein
MKQKINKTLARKKEKEFFKRKFFIFSLNINLELFHFPGKSTNLDAKNRSDIGAQRNAHRYQYSTEAEHLSIVFQIVIGRVIGKVKNPNKLTGRMKNAPTTVPSRIPIPPMKIE